MRIRIVTLLAGVIVAQFQSSAQGATLVHNVRGYSVSATALTRYSEFVFDHGVVVAVGSGELTRQFPDAKKIDGRGKTVLPGLIDAHGHVAGLGFGAEQIVLTDTRSLREALGKVAIFADANPDTDWLLGFGWNQVLWENPEFPVSADLDRIVAERPVWLERVDGHAGWANTAALKAAGITASTADPAGGRIHRDESGQPTGVLVDAAMKIVEAVIPPESEQGLSRVIPAALGRLAALGVTGVHDAGVSSLETKVYRELADRNKLPIRVYAMLDEAGEVLTEFDKPLRNYAEGMLTIASVKIYADGALGSRGAAMIGPYSDESDNTGLLFGTTKEIAASIKRSNEFGFQANVHAIGDRANQVVLDAFESVQGAKPSTLRNRIEHAQIVTLNDIDRFAELGIIASMQPIHATSDKNMAEDRVGPSRIRGGYAWRRMLDSGVVIAGGSDFPVEPENPMFGLHAAVTRKDRQGKPDGGWYRDQALTREEALRAFTQAAAYASHQEAMLGQILPGYRADFIMIDQDYFTMPADDIWQIKVLQTWVNGRKVYSRE